MSAQEELRELRLVQIVLNTVRARCYLGADSKLAAQALDDIDGLINALADGDQDLVVQYLRAFEVSDAFFHGLLRHYRRLGFPDPSPE